MTTPDPLLPELIAELNAPRTDLTNDWFIQSLLNHGWDPTRDAQHEGAINLWGKIVNNLRPRTSVTCGEYLSMQSEIRRLRSAVKDLYSGTELAKKMHAETIQECMKD